MKRVFSCMHTQVPITHDALRMRTRRLCEKKTSGRCGVPDAIHNDYVEGGEKREILEMSLLQCLAQYGLDRKWYKRVHAGMFHYPLYVKL